VYSEHKRHMGAGGRFVAKGGKSFALPRAFAVLTFRSWTIKQTDTRAESQSRTDQDTMVNAGMNQTSRV